MNIHSILSLSPGDNALAQQLWEENMHEPWSDYDGADMFVVVHFDEVVGGFAVYRDESDDITGIFCSGWAGRHKKVPVADIIKQIASNVGDLYFKTDKRAAKILLEKIGKKVKTTDRFVYYIVKR
ncbi:MAG: hypothetical protein J6S67_14055 [Methanobrevibacter sp.]|nr:hypothetical protein [Methanobrevibacter sp.]